MGERGRVQLERLRFEELERLLAGWKAPRPRTLAREVWRWFYQRGAACFDQMETLPRPLRERLAAEVTFHVPPVLARQENPEGGARKDLLQMADGERVEVVLLRYRQRRSACISTQVGCGCGCIFCATGQAGFVRQLSAEEIVAQVLHLQRDLAIQGEQLSNVILMGMGEPLLNYEQTVAAVRRLVDPRAAGFVQRRVTLSTVGIPAEIERLAGEIAYGSIPLQVNLAISLHAATDALRDRLVPINRRYPLDALFAALRAYAAQAKRRVMVEWVMIEGVNDTPEQAEALAARLAGLDAHVNLIQLNPTPGYDGRPSTPEAIDAFEAVLDRAGVPHTVRQRRGTAIAAGCGQLRLRSS